MSSFRTWIATLLAVVASACTPPEADPVARCAEIGSVGRPADAPLVLIVNDTMRRDRVGIYGGAADTPHFDGFGRENLLFERAYTQAPWTKPAMATLFTSLYPSQHGLISHPHMREVKIGEGAPLREVDVLGDGFVTLAEVLQEAGYRTAAFVTNPWLDGTYGFAQGFDLYGDSFARWGQSGSVAGQAALSWLDRVPPGQKYFLYVHYIDTHRPYGRLYDADVAANLESLRREPPLVGSEAKTYYEELIADPRQAFSPQVRAQLKAIGPTRAFYDLAYDRGVEDFDRALGEFLEGLARHPSYERAAIVITSDHGEALFERGYGSHGRGLLVDEAGIPLAMKLPGSMAPEARIDCPVGLIDLMPTLCDYLGVTCPESVFGRSILGAGGGRERGYVVTEGVMQQPANRAIRTRAYTLIWQPGGAPGRTPPVGLFDTTLDPAEQRDLLAAEHRSPQSIGVARALRAELAGAVPDFIAPERELVPLDPEIEKRLRALGYLD